MQFGRHLVGRVRKDRPEPVRGAVQVGPVLAVGQPQVPQPVPEPDQQCGVEIVRADGGGGALQERQGGLIEYDIRIVAVRRAPQPGFQRVHPVTAPVRVRLAVVRPCLTFARTVNRDRLCTRSWR